MNDNQPTIFLIEADDDARPILRENLRRDGYHVSVALDEEDALERVSGGHLHADLILINLDGPPQEVLSTARRIRQHAELDGTTPIIVLAAEYPKELEGKDILVGEQEYVTYLEEPDQLQHLLARLLPRRASTA
jgi:DNA-binding response OmpR family regulator